MYISRRFGMTLFDIREDDVSAGAGARSASSALGIA